MKHFIFLILCFLSISSYADYVVKEKYFEQRSSSKGDRLQISRIVYSDSSSGRDVTIVRYDMTTADGRNISKSSTTVQEPVLIGNEMFRANYTPPMSPEDLTHIQTISALEFQKSVHRLPVQEQGLAKTYAPNLSYTPVPTLTAADRVRAEQFARNIETTSRELQSYVRQQEHEQQIQRQQQKAVIEFANNIKAQITRERDYNRAVAAQSATDAFQNILDTTDILKIQKEIRDGTVKIDRIIDEDSLSGQDFLKNTKDFSALEKAKLLSDKMSPLNTRRDQNRKELRGLLDVNDLIKNNIFRGSELNLPENTYGHEFMTSANELSALADFNGSHPVARNILGAGYVYLKGSQIHLNSGDINGANELLNKGQNVIGFLTGKNDSTQYYENPNEARELHEQAYRDVLNDSTSSFEGLMQKAYGQTEVHNDFGVVVGEVGAKWLEVGRQVVTNEVFKDVALTIADVALGLTPGVGFAKDVTEFLSNRNVLTGKTLTTVERSVALIGILTVGGASGLFKAVPKIVEGMGAVYRGSKDLALKSYVAVSSYTHVYGNFLNSTATGLRTAIGVQPALIAKGFSQSPGATLALGQNIARYGAESGAELLNYAVREGMDITKTAHLSEFLDGQARFVSKSDLEVMKKTGFVSGKDMSENFTISKSAADSLTHLYKDTEKLEKVLMVGKDRLGGVAVRIDIPFNTKYNPRLPTGAEKAANQFFESGGKIKGSRIRELVNDPIDFKDVIIHIYE